MQHCDVKTKTKKKTDSCVEIKMEIQIRNKIEESREMKEMCDSVEEMKGRTAPFIATNPPPRTLMSAAFQPALLQNVAIR